MSWTQFNQLGSCEVRHLTQLRSTDFIWSGQLWRMSEDRLWVKRRFSHELNQMHNQWYSKLSHVNVWIRLKCMNQPWSQFFSNMAAFILSPHMLIILCRNHHVTVNVFAYYIDSVFHNQRPCNGYHELYSWRNIDFTLKNHWPARLLFLFLWCSSMVRLK